MIDKFKTKYINELNLGLDSISNEVLETALYEIELAIKENRNIFVCGNGGSAAISEHLSCDHSKGIASNTKFFPRVHSLPSNMSLITAIANDFGYDEIFSYQLRTLANKNDVLICISSSGNSLNILNALQTAQALNLKTISFTGFDGGQAKLMSDVNLHIPVNNYGIVEDCHQILMHILAQHIRTIHTNVDLENVKM